MIEYTVKVYDNGTKSWYLDGKLHREGGPAVEYANGDKYWFLNDQRISEKEFNERMAPAKELTVEEISKILGYNVKVVKE